VEEEQGPKKVSSMPHMDAASKCREWTQENAIMNLQKTVLVALAGVLLMPACQSKPKRYNLRGRVMAKTPAASEIIVDHEEIPGFMAAMTMPYKVKDPAVVAEVEPGDVIAAEVVVTNNGNDYWLEDVRITDESGRKTAKPVVTSHMLPIGAPVPDLPLTNQDGKSFRLTDLKGKAVLLTFIYTRCPMPTFCPRLSGQFAKIHEDLAKTPDDYAKTHLVTISFDPKYDTAPVLRQYGLAYLDNNPAGFSHWDFASTNPGDLRKIADAFGLAYFEEDNQISHTMVVALIAPDGTIAKYWGTQWTADELEAALRGEAKKSSASLPANKQAAAR
jgi:protein SCO1/2